MTARTGRVLHATSGRYDVLDDGGERIRCRARRRLERSDPAAPEFPVPGDRVEWSPLAEVGAGVIDCVLPRQSEISRTRAGKKHVVAANLDQLVVVVAVRNPGLDRGLLDRLLAVAEHNRIAARVCLHKFDLAEPGEFDGVGRVYERAGYPVLCTSTQTGAGIDALRQVLQGHVSAFMGPSGAGKTRLIGSLQPGLRLRTGDVSDKTGQGRHTTTRVDLHPTDFGALLADTPGVRDFSPWRLDPEELRDLFPEIRKRQEDCRFKSCTHDHEPGCAIKAGVQQGEIDLGRHQSYLAILAELREQAADRTARRHRRERP
jgi:ribosome biogenesis GTPase